MVGFPLTILFQEKHCNVAGMLQCQLEEENLRHVRLLFPATAGWKLAMRSSEWIRRRWTYGNSPIDPPNMNSAFFAERNGWRPGRDSQQNFFGYNFSFIMLPTQLNNPKPSYCLISENITIAVYYPLIFVRLLHCNKQGSIIWFSSKQTASTFWPDNDFLSNSARRWIIWFAVYMS